jgi:hypothetical protein
MLFSLSPRARQLFVRFLLGLGRRDSAELVTANATANTVAPQGYVLHVLAVINSMVVSTDFAARCFSRP